MYTALEAQRPFSSGVMQNRFSRKSTGQPTAKKNPGDKDAGLGKKEEHLHELPEAGSDQGRRQFFKLEIPEIYLVGEAEDLEGRQNDAEKDHGVRQKEDERTALVSPPACNSTASSGWRCQ